MKLPAVRRFRTQQPVAGGLRRQGCMVDSDARNLLDALANGVRLCEVEGRPLHGRQLAGGDLVDVCWRDITPACGHEAFMSKPATILRPAPHAW